MSNRDAQALFGALSAGFVAVAVAFGAYAGTLGNEQLALAAAVFGAIGGGIAAALTAYRSARG